MIVASGIAMQFGAKPLFENVTVKFGGGNRYGLIGANGCGKSTFMKILGGDLEPTAGSVAIDSSERVGKLLTDVGLSPQDADKYPHEFSGGQRQRISIARALSSNPEFLVCDEPTSALDVSVQAQILNLLEDMKARYGLTLIFIAHDLAVVKNVSDRIVVMYLGKICEVSTPDALYKQPAHLYTAGLLASIPRLGEKRARLEVIQGVVPNPLNLPKGCLFKRRCPYAMPVCDTSPPLQQVSPGHLSRCWLTADGEPPAVGEAPTPEAAEEARVALSVGQ